LYQKSHGIDNRELEVSRQRKSLAIETTLMTDVYSEMECLQVIEKLYPKLVDRLAKVEGRQIVRQGIKLKFNDFNQTTVEQQSLAAEVNIFNILLPKALERANGRGIRLVGLTLGFSVPTTESEIQSKQLSLL
jgi:DNA polymerase-4